MLSSPSHREQQLRWPPLPVLTRGHTLLGIEMEKSCSECSEQRGAQSLCTFCNKWLCYQCTDMHQHQKATATNTTTTTTINTSSTQYADLHQLARPTSTQCPDMHQRGNGSLTTIEPGPGLHPRSVLTCHSHRQEPLELFCESCDLLCCNSCHLSTHKNHRLVHIGKALQDQQWLFESLVAQVDERRSAVENTAKQTEDRLHGIKIMHRKAENQIKMAKMIMMNELNKRAHLLIEQLEKITEDFQRNLEDQLQGAIETCGQLDHVQRFITWATTQHGRSPVLFSRELISLQMQQLFESSFHQDAWVPVKIKFNWDASYWTKQISTLGELDVEGGDCSYPEGLACPDILRPTPMGCLALPSVCHRGPDQGCGYQACCHPQICCMHCIPSKTDMANLDQSQLEAVPYSSSCAQHALLQSQQIQRCCGPASPPLMHSSLQCPTPPQATSPTQLGSSHGSTSQSRPATPQPQLKSHHRQCRVEQYSDCQAQLTADSDRPGQAQGQCQGKPLACKTSQAQRLDQTAAGREITTEESWEPRWRGEQSLGHTPLVESRDSVGRGSQQGRREYISLEQQQMFYISPAAELRREQQGNRLSLPHTDYRNRRARSTSLSAHDVQEVSAHDVQSGSSSVCGRRKNRSQSFPAELAAPSTSPPANERPAGPAYSLDQYGVMDARQRRASDGVIQCAARETSTAVAPLRGQSTMYLHPGPLLTYKTESDNAYGYTNEEVTKEKYRAQRNSPKNREVQKEAGSPRVPMVCLERLKVLVSRLPPHGRRQSDPLPASGVETSGAFLQHRTWRGGMAEGMADGSDTMRTILSHITPPYTSEQRSPRQSTTPPVIHELHSHGKGSSLKDLAQPAAATDPKHEPQRYSAAPDLDSDSDPRSGSEELELFSEPDLDSEPQLESDTPPESDQHPESSSETEGESMTKAESVAAREMGLCGKTDILRLSEPGAEYEPDPESDTGMGSDNGEEQDADVESGDAEAESDIQPDSDPSLEADYDILSDQAADSQGSVGSEPEIESEPELTTDEPQPLRSTTTGTDDPQPLRCDQQEGPPIGPGQRPLLIANSCPPRGCDRSVDAQPDQGNTEMESEDYCAVCLIGGDLLCCDRCPKVFHLSCHIPPLRCFPTGDWICTLCRDVMRPEMEYDCENERTSGHHASSSHGLSTCDQRKCERLTLLIFSNILSAPFHEPVSPLARHYYQIIKRPMDLSVIRAKLNKRNTRHYYSTEEFVADVYLMFRNCAKFNYPDSEVAQAGHSLEAFFNSKLKEVFPDKVFPMAEEEPDSDEYDEAYRATENGFPWPAGTEQCHRKRKRRHSVNSKRHQV